MAKVIFLHLFVILFTGRGGGGCLPQCMLGYHPPEQTSPRNRPPSPLGSRPPMTRPHPPRPDPPATIPPPPPPPRTRPPHLAFLLHFKTFQEVRSKTPPFLLSTTECFSQLVRSGVPRNLILTHETESLSFRFVFSLTAVQVHVYLIKTKRTETAIVLNRYFGQKLHLHHIKNIIEQCCSFSYSE